MRLFRCGSLAFVLLALAFAPSVNSFRFEDEKAPSKAETEVKTTEVQDEVEKVNFGEKTDEETNREARKVEGKEIKMFDLIPYDI